MLRRIADLVAIALLVSAITRASLLDDGNGVTLAGLALIASVIGWLASESEAEQ